MSRALAAAGLAILALAGAACRQVTGLDQFQVQCVPGEPDCPDSGAPEDCVEGLDTNGDGVLPAVCTGEVAWARVTDGTTSKTCPDWQGGIDMIDPARALAAMASFGSWGASIGTLRGSLNSCEVACTVDSHALDAAGESLGFAPPLPCDDGLFVRLARGESHAYAAAAVDSANVRALVLSGHRLADASSAWRWEWHPPDGIGSFLLAADTSALMAVGQSGRLLFVEVADDFQQARFHQMAGTVVSSMALTQATGTRTLLLAGQTVSPADDPGPCDLGATSPAAFIASVPLGQGSTDPAAATSLACSGTPLKVDIGTDTGAPSTRVAARPDGRACWAYLGTDGATGQRRLRVGCFALDAASSGWKQEAILGDHLAEDVDIAVDPFGHAVVAAALVRVTQLPLWGGVTVPLAAAETPNILVLKLHRDTGAVVWAKMFAVPGSSARNPRVAVDDDGAVRLGLVADGKALKGGGFQGIDGTEGLAVHFVGLLP